MTTITPAKSLKRRTQATRREESDRKMLRAASQLIGRQGLTATTLAEIGLAAGYSSGLPVVRYGSKLGLLEALLDDMERWCEATYTAATKDRRGMDSLRARIAAHVGSARTLPEGSAAFQAILIEARYAFPSLESRVAALIEQWRRGFRDDLLDAQRLGEVPEDLDCDAYASLIHGAIRGMLIGQQGHGLEELQRKLPPLICGMVQRPRA